LKQIATGIATVTAGSAVAAARGGRGDRGMASEGRGASERRGASVDDGIVKTAEDLGFTKLITAVESADPAVLKTLTNDDQYTVFAPTNKAFSDFFNTVEQNKNTNLTEADLLNDKNNLLTETLLYHVTDGRRYSQSVVNAPEIDTLLGESFSVDGQLDGRANIETADVEAANGVIHAIDAVLTTPAVDDLL
jgi:uncharacterized surface protein with fasciclin (FAS1) repeats